VPADFACPRGCRCWVPGLGRWASWTRWGRPPAVCRLTAPLRTRATAALGSEDLRDDLHLEVDYLGIVVNLYDPRRGYIATSSLQAWMDIKDPRVVAVVGDLTEQRKAVRLKQPLLSYAPTSEQAVTMRALAREIS
jgi:hypothetical protein